MTLQAPIDLAALGLDEAAIHALRFQGGTVLDNPYIDMVMAPAFLNADECALLCGMIDANRRPSTVAYGVANARTSETCAFDAAEPLVQLLDLRISLFLGVGPQFGEPIQGQRYAEGQEFKLHTDYFEPGHPDQRTNAARCGQRTWTAMIYLNAPQAGGETFFHYLDHDFVPQTGTMLCWNNVDAAGKPNPYTLHQGKPVIAGTKYIVTKWFREQPWAGTPAKPKSRAIKGRR
ncbi:MAG: 2OG-Fe(II) oxygenase [Sphingomonas taxi]